MVGRDMQKATPPHGCNAPGAKSKPQCACASTTRADFHHIVAPARTRSAGHTCLHITSRPVVPRRERARKLEDRLPRGRVRKGRRSRRWCCPLPNNPTAPARGQRVQRDRLALPHVHLRAHHRVRCIREPLMSDVGKERDMFRLQYVLEIISMDSKEGEREKLEPGTCALRCLQQRTL